MPNYQITEYRGVNLVGLSASSTSKITAKDIKEAQLKATCINQPSGHWKEIKQPTEQWEEGTGIHMIGNVEDGDLSIIEELENPKFIEYDLQLAIQFGTFQKSKVYKAFCHFMILSKTQSHWLDVAYLELLKEKFGIDFHVKIGF